MEVKANYKESLTNLACSIRKYFDLKYSHNTLDYIDRELAAYKPKNVVTLLCDGMGSNIMDRLLDTNSFLIEHRIKPISSVFPPTTVAATTSMVTGLNPCETGMLGWHSYYKDLDKVITTYRHSEKGDLRHLVLPEAIEYRKKHMKEQSIASEINHAGKYQGYEIYPFGEDPYRSIDDMFYRIYERCNRDGKKYVYAYDENPDSTMHLMGCDHKTVQSIMKNLDHRIEQLSNQLTDTMLFVVADHGHINVENIFLDDYPDILDCLSRTTSIESRAVNFFIKPDKKDEFVEKFHMYFGQDFDLYPMEEVIESHLFGDGEENPIFRDLLGDYLAIAKTNKTLTFKDQHAFKSNHAGNTEDELLVPLVLVKTRKSF